MSATGNADVKLLFGAEKGSAGKITEDLLSILKTLDSQNIFKITIGIKDINQADISRISGKIATSVQTAVTNAISVAMTNTPTTATAALSKTASTGVSAKAVKKSVSDTTASYTNMGKSISSASGAITSMSKRLDTFSNKLGTIPTTFNSATEAANAFATALERITGAAGGVKTAVGGIGGTRSGSVGIVNDSTNNTANSGNIIYGSQEYFRFQKQLNPIFTTERQYNNWSAAKNSKNPEVQDAYQKLGTIFERAHTVQNDLRNEMLPLTGENSAQNQIRTLTDDMNRYVGVLKDAGVNTQSWSTKLGAMAKRLTQWFGTYQVILMLYRGLRQMVSAVADIDKAMTELKKVTDASNSTYEKFLTNATKRAKTLGATIADTVSATSDFARLGYGIEDAEKLADAAIVYKNVGDGIEDIGTASESIISTMQAFGVGANDVMSIVDKFNNVGNNFAISSKGVGDVLMRSAAALNAANNTLDESIALAAAANTVIQDPEKVGTALKTISMFLRASKTEAEEAGIETEGMANSVSELARDISRLTDGKVQIQPDKDSFKSTFQIIKELSEVWDELSETSQANITEMIGGKRNSNVISALLENFAVAEDALAESLDSEGSAMAENQKQLESLEGRVTLFKASFQELSTVLFDSETLKGFVDFGTFLMNILTGISKLIGLVGGLENVLGGLAAALSVVYAKSVFAFGEKAISGIVNFLTWAPKQAIKFGGAWGTAWATSKNPIRSFSSGFKALTHSVTGAQWAMTGIMAVIIAITAAIKIYNKHLEKLQESVDKGKEVADESKQLSDLIKQYSKLEKDENGSLTSSSREQAVNIEEQITELIGKQADGLDLVNGKYDEQLEKLRKIHGEQANSIYADVYDAKTSAENLLSTHAKGTWWDRTSHFENAPDQYVNGTLVSLGAIGAGYYKSEDEMRAMESFISDNDFEHLFWNDTSPDEINHLVSFDISTPEAIISAYEEMGKAREILTKSYKDEISEGGALEDFYNRLTAKYNNLSSAVNQYKEALKNYNTTYALDLFNNQESAQKVGIGAGAFANTETSMQAWLNTVIKSDKITDEVKTNLIELAKVQFPNLAKTISETTSELIKNEAATATMDDVNAGTIEGLYDMGVACGGTAKEILDLLSKEILYNNTNLDTSQKIDALKKLAQQAGITKGAILGLSGSDAATSVDDIHTLGVSAEYNYKDKKYHYYYKGKDYGASSNNPESNPALEAATSDALWDAYLDTVSNWNDSGDGDGNGYVPPPTDKNQKNEALDNYLKDAENRYKVHQDEEKYIKELQWAHDNLTKDEKERLDIIGKINEAYRDLADNRIKDLEHQIELKKELYGDDYNTTSEWSKIQTIAHEEADRLRGMGYDDNSNEIQELQKTWWDAENDKLTWRLNDSKDWIDARNQFGDWGEHGDSEVKAWERVINWLKTEFPHAMDEIKDAEKSLFEAQKKEVQNTIDDMESYIDERNMYGDWSAFADNEVSAIRRVMAYTKDARAQELLTYEEYCDKMKELSKNLYEALKKDVTEALEHNSSQLDSLKTLTEAYYEVSNSVAEARHEINKELEASKTMYQYLDEETRKLLFNEEDYIALSEKLNSIQSAADELQRNYNEEVLGATAENLDEITSKYQMQYETMMKQYEIAKAELDIAKKRQQLDNVLNERNVRMFIGGQWQWVANTQDVIEAQKELADAEYEKQKSQTDLFQQNTLNTLTTASDKLKTVINQVESGVINLNTDVGNVCNGLRNIENVALPALNRILNGAAAVIGTYTGEVGTAKTNAYNFGGSGGSPISSGSTNSSLRNVYESNDYSIAIQKALAAGDIEGAKRANNIRNDKIDYLHLSEKKLTDADIEKMAKERHADGTRFAPGGLTLLGEEGAEVLVTSNGVAIPINRPSIGNLSPGGVVFNSTQLNGLRHLWDLVQPGNFPNVSSQNSSSISYDQSITINGMKVDSGSENGKALISALRRYVGNH